MSAGLRRGEDWPKAVQVLRRPPFQVKPLPLMPSALRTPKQRQRFKRNIAVFVCHQAGFSINFLAQAFDLPRSRIWAIIKDFSARTGTAS